jgi:hypothetical protein
MIGAGLKKCKPTKFFLRLSLKVAARASMERELVLEASIVLEEKC